MRLKPKTLAIEYITVLVIIGIVLATGVVA
jgi:hypothetical protein